MKGNSACCLEDKHFSFLFYLSSSRNSVSLSLVLLNVEVYTGNYAWICISRILRAKTMPFFPDHTTYCFSRYLGNLVQAKNNGKILEFPLCHDCRSFFLVEIGYITLNLPEKIV